MFEPSTESLGTKRILDLAPMFYGLIHSNTLLVVDEIETSIHPLLIKEYLKQFSEHPDAKGQLIFTTHESQLMSLDLFRPDEYRIVKKDQQGNTSIHSLSDFKDLQVDDIRQGYFDGRYQGIPVTHNIDITRPYADLEE